MILLNRYFSDMKSFTIFAQHQCLPEGSTVAISMARALMGKNQYENIKSATVEPVIMNRSRWRSFIRKEMANFLPKTMEFAYLHL